MFTADEELIECVPNFSEGRNPETIEAIAEAIRQTPGVKLMHVDAGYDANRSVYTFAGRPDAVAEAAFRAIKCGSERIDMRLHQGEHPRMGACDVCPLIPIQHITMDEVVALSKELGKRIGDLGIPVYLYEHSASSPIRKNLSYLRKGEYESIPDKMLQEDWKPDYGPQLYHAQFGMMALGARDFLLAYNINLDCTDLESAKQLAASIRRIREKQDGSYASRLFSHVKVLAWWMEAYGCAQISTNITDIRRSPVVDVFETIRDMAREAGIGTKGSELIGMIPMRAFARIDQEPSFVSRQDIEAVVKQLGLDSLRPFDIDERVLEYHLQKD